MVTDINMAEVDRIYCSRVHKVAEISMSLRNDGYPLNKMLEEFKEGDMQAIILRAYEYPRGVIPNADFANDEMVRCLKG